MESALVSGFGEWYYAILIAVFSTFFGLVSIKLGDTLAAIREIALNTRKKIDEEEADIEYEETEPRILYVKGFIFSTKGLFTILGLGLIIIGWIPVLVKFKQLIGIK